MEPDAIAVVETVFAADVMAVRSLPVLLAMALAIAGSVMEIFGARLAMAVASPDGICNLSR